MRTYRSHSGVNFCLLSWLGSRFFSSLCTYSIFQYSGGFRIVMGNHAGGHHAEVVAHRVGQPFGSLILSLSVTAIEAALIISIMLASGEEGKTIARDTVFAAVMIILNGMVGISIFAGSVRFREQKFILGGVNAVLITLIAISILTLVLPNYIVSVPGPFYSDKQLIFVAIVSLILYASFVFVQYFQHQDYFIEHQHKETVDDNKPSRKQTIISSILLLACLGAVVMLAETLAPGLNNLLDKYALLHSLVGMVIACIVLLSKGLSAYRAAKNNELQQSLNLSLGSALASIGLTIPIVSIVSIATGTQITLGLEAVPTILFLLTLLIIILSLSIGRTTVLHGITLLIIFLE
jgi:Ca2+:H+ antiporter